MPKVSVILPNYNHQKYLSKRIESILNQSFVDFELIILDDASKDDSREVIQTYVDKDKRITHFIKRKVNSGSTFIQWEKGISLAKGEFIWIAESDDWAAPTFLEEIMEEFLHKPQAGVVFCPSIWVDDQDAVIHVPDFESSYGVWEGNELITSTFLTSNPIYNASSCVFRKSLLGNIHFEEIRTFRYTGDWLFWVQLVSDTTVIKIEKRLNYFRRHDANVSFKSDSEGLLFIEGKKVTDFILKNHSVSFWNKRKTAMRWARKLINSEIVDKESVLARLSTEVQMYYKLFKFL
jgi:glycosyltransferase involved in cell wall biosynthesis